MRPQDWLFTIPLRLEWIERTDRGDYTCPGALDIGIHG